MRSRTDTASTIVWCGVSLRHHGDVAELEVRRRPGTPAGPSAGPARPRGDVDSIDCPRPQGREHGDDRPSTLGRGSVLVRAPGWTAPASDAAGAWSTRRHGDPLHRLGGARLTGEGEHVTHPGPGGDLQELGGGRRRPGWWRAAGSRWTCSLTSRVCWVDCRTGPEDRHHRGGGSDGPRLLDRAERGVTPSPELYDPVPGRGTWDSTTATTRDGWLGHLGGPGTSRSLASPPGYGAGPVRRETAGCAGERDPNRRALRWGAGRAGGVDDGTNSCAARRRWRVLTRQMVAGEPEMAGGGGDRGPVATYWGEGWPRR